jgi:hypothetical protein
MATTTETKKGWGETMWGYVPSAPKLSSFLPSYPYNYEEGDNDPENDENEYNNNTQSENEQLFEEPSGAEILTQFKASNKQEANNINEYLTILYGYISSLEEGDFKNFIVDFYNYLTNLVVRKQELQSKYDLLKDVVHNIEYKNAVLDKMQANERRNFKRNFMNLKEKCSVTSQQLESLIIENEQLMEKNRLLELEVQNIKSNSLLKASSYKSQKSDNNLRIKTLLDEINQLKRARSVVKKNIRQLNAKLNKQSSKINNSINSYKTVAAAVPPARAGVAVPPARAGVAVPPARAGVAVPPARAGVAVPPARAGVAVPPARAGVAVPPARAGVAVAAPRVALPSKAESAATFALPSAPPQRINPPLSPKTPVAKRSSRLVLPMD